MNLPDLIRSFYRNLKNSFKNEKRHIEKADFVSGKDQIETKNDKISSSCCNCVNYYLKTRIQLNQHLQKMNSIEVKNSKKCESMTKMLEKELNLLENIHHFN